MEITFQVDRELAKRLRRTEREYRADQAHARWLRTPYAKRMKAYMEVYEHLLLLGQGSWYRSLKTSMLLPEAASYFRPDEFHIICLMRGSKRVMRQKYQQRYALPTDVWKRYLRRIKLTCMGAQAYCAWARNKQRIIHRIEDKWEGEIHFNLIFGQILLEGRPVHVTKEQRAVIESMHRVQLGLDKLSGKAISSTLS